MSATKFTPGPWRWELNEKSRSVQLCGGSPKAGFGAFDLTVMDFVRWGMNGAAPRLRDDSNIMRRADDFRLVAPLREHHADWFKLIQHPDACLIEAAPDLYSALNDLLGDDRELGGRDTPRIRAAKTALRKARGEPSP